MKPMIFDRSIFGLSIKFLLNSKHSCFLVKISLAFTHDFAHFVLFHTNIYSFDTYFGHHMLDQVTSKMNNKCNKDP